MARSKTPLLWLLFSAGGTVAALAAVAAGSPLVAAPALGLAVAAIALHRWEDHRAHGLAGRLRAAADGEAGREDTFRALVSELSLSCKLRWAAVLSWRAPEGTGEIELEWNAGARGPSETALTSWLVRDAEAASNVLVASANFAAASSASPRSSRTRPAVRCAKPTA